MTQRERRLYLISELLKEQPGYKGMEIPEDEDGQKRLLRSLFNIRMPRPAGQEFLAVQDAYLQEETQRKGITDFADLQPVREGIYLWQGDITPCAVTRSSMRPTARCWGALPPATGVLTMPFLTQSHRGLPGQARSNAAALRISVGFDCP